MKSTFICIIGIDGSGKTSHAKALAKSLKQKGLPCKYVWARWTPQFLKPIQFVLNKFYFKSKSVYTSNYEEYTKEKRKIIGNHVLGLIWQYLVLLDYFFQYLFKIRLPLLFRQIIVCDRYIYDTMVDLMVNFNFSGEETEGNFMRYFLSLFTKPDLIFLLDVPEVVACKRRGDLGLLNYLTDRRKIYLELSHALQASVLDNSKNFAEVQSNIVNVVESVMTNE